MFTSEVEGWYERLFNQNVVVHAVPLHEHSYGEAIPYYSLNGCILDSGADDEEHFPKGFIEY